MNKDVSEVIKNYVTTLAIIIGGGWTIYTFNKLNEAKINDLEIQKRQEERLGNLSLEISINATQTDSSRGIMIELVFKNIGSRYIPILMDYKSMTLFKLKSYNSKSGLGSSLYDFVNSKYIVADIGAGQTDSSIYYTESPGFFNIQPFTTSKVNYYTVVDYPGIYLLTFKVPMDDITAKETETKENFNKDSISIIPNSKREERDVHKWICTKFIEIK